MSQVPARIHVLLASKAPLGVVIRRGPSKHVATLLWNRRRDTFQLGQWLKGRIYERRSDLSPDGRFFIYFASNGKWDSEGQGAWTAISGAPYLKAMAMFPKGDCWHGGGLWTGNRTYWLNDGYGHGVLRDTQTVRRDEEFIPDNQYGGECPGVYYPRLLRDGWKLIVAEKKKAKVFERALTRGWRLRKIAQAGPPEFGKGCYWDEHLLVNEKTGKEVPCPDWEWADIDRDRLVWASAGKLFSGKIKSSGLTEEVELFDFNDMKFEAITAPY